MTKLEDRLNRIKALTSDYMKYRKESKYPIDDELVISLLEEGARMSEIAKIYGCSPQTIKYQMRIMHQDFDARKYHKWKKRDLSVEKVVRLYKKLKSSTKIAKLLNVETHVITDRLKSVDVKLRPLYREDILTKEVVRLYKKYGTTTKIAESLDTDPGLIRRRLKEAGIKVTYKSVRINIPYLQVIKLHNNGKSISSIAKKHNVSWNTIKRILISGER